MLFQSAAGGELEQIQFLLGHVSVETTERYLGCKQRLRQTVNDKIGLEQWTGYTSSGSHASPMEEKPTLRPRCPTGAPHAEVRPIPVCLIRSNCRRV